MYMLQARVGCFIAFALALGAASAVATIVNEAPLGRIVVTETETEILDVVDFAPGTALIKPTSWATLDAVAATMQGNPGIELIEVQSHTSGVGDDAANLALTELRADAVEAYLVAQGVQPQRLESHGYGDTQPIERIAGSKKNERIAFLILRRQGE